MAANSSCCWSGDLPSLNLGDDSIDLANNLLPSNSFSLGSSLPLSSDALNQSEQIHSSDIRPRLLAAIFSDRWLQLTRQLPTDNPSEVKRVFAELDLYLPLDKVRPGLPFMSVFPDGEPLDEGLPGLWLSLVAVIFATSPELFLVNWSRCAPDYKQESINRVVDVLRTLVCSTDKDIDFPGDNLFVFGDNAGPIFDDFSAGPIFDDFSAGPELTFDHDEGPTTAKAPLAICKEDEIEGDQIDVGHLKFLQGNFQASVIDSQLPTAGSIREFLLLLHLEIRDWSSIDKLLRSAGAHVSSHEEKVVQLCCSLLPDVSADLLRGEHRDDCLAAMQPFTELLHDYFEPDDEQGCWVVSSLPVRTLTLKVWGLPSVNSASLEALRSACQGVSTQLNAMEKEDLIQRMFCTIVLIRLLDDFDIRTDLPLDSTPLEQLHDCYERYRVKDRDRAETAARLKTELNGRITASSMLAFFKSTPVDRPFRAAALAKPTTLADVRVSLAWLDNVQQYQLASTVQQPGIGLSVQQLKGLCFPDTNTAPRKSRVLINDPTALLLNVYSPVAQAPFRIAEIGLNMSIKFDVNRANLPWLSDYQAVLVPSPLGGHTLDELIRHHRISLVDVEFSIEQIEDAVPRLVAGRSYSFGLNLSEESTQSLKVNELLPVHQNIIPTLTTDVQFHHSDGGRMIDGRRFLLFVHKPVDSCSTFLRQLCLSSSPLQESGSDLALLTELLHTYESIPAAALRTGSVESFFDAKKLNHLVHCARPSLLQLRGCESLSSLVEQHWRRRLSSSAALSDSQQLVYGDAKMEVGSMLLQLLTSHRTQKVAAIVSQSQVAGFCHLLGAMRLSFKEHHLNAANLDSFQSRVGRYLSRASLVFLFVHVDSTINLSRATRVFHQLQPSSPLRWIFVQDSTHAEQLFLACTTNTSHMLIRSRFFRSAPVRTLPYRDLSLPFSSAVLGSERQPLAVDPQASASYLCQLREESARWMHDVLQLVVDFQQRPPPSNKLCLGVVADEPAKQIDRLFQLLSDRLLHKTKVKHLHVDSKGGGIASLQIDQQYDCQIVVVRGAHQLEPQQKKLMYSRLKAQPTLFLFVYSYFEASDLPVSDLAKLFVPLPIIADELHDAVRCFAGVLYMIFGEEHSLGQLSAVSSESDLVALSNLLRSVAPSLDSRQLHAVVKQCYQLAGQSQTPRLTEMPPELLDFAAEPLSSFLQLVACYARWAMAHRHGQLLLLPFCFWLKHTPSACLLSQRARVAAWLQLLCCHAFSDGEQSPQHLDQLLARIQLPAALPNVDSCQPLDCLLGARTATTAASFSYSDACPSLEAQYLVQHSASKESLPWQLLAERSDFPADVGVLCSLAFCSREFLKWLAIVELSRLFELLNALEPFDPLMPLHQRVLLLKLAELVEDFPPVPELRSLLAVLRWFVVTKDVPVSARLLESDDIAALARHKLPLSNFGPNSTVSILSNIFPLDAPADLLILQVDIRNLVTSSPLAVLAPVVDNDELVFGQVAVDYFVHKLTDTASNSCTGDLFIRHPFVRFLQDIVHRFSVVLPSPYPLHSDPRTQRADVFARIVGHDLAALWPYIDRLSARSLASLVTAAPNQETVHFLACLLYERFDRLNGNVGHFLSDFLPALLEALGTSCLFPLDFVEKLHTLIVSTDKADYLDNFGCFVNVQVRNGVHALLYQSLDVYLESVAEIPVEGLFWLHSLLLERFSDANFKFGHGVGVVLEHVRTALPVFLRQLTPGGLQVVLSMFRVQPQLLANAQVLCYVCWACAPFQSIHVEPHDAELLLRICGLPEIDFARRADKSYSSLAQFLVCSWRLELSALNYHRASFGLEPIARHRELICQENDAEFAAYFLSWYHYPAPLQLLEDELLRDFRQQWRRPEPPATLLNETQVERQGRRFRIDISSGLSAASLRANLTALANSRYLTHQPTRHAMQTVLLIWFRSCGFVVPQFAIEFQLCASVDEFTAHYLPPNELNCYEARTIFPFPAKFDTRLVRLQKVRVLDPSPDGAAYSLNRAESLFQCFGVPVAELRLPLVDQLLVETRHSLNHSSYQRSDDYTTLFRTAASRLAELLHPVFLAALDSRQQVGAKLTFAIEPLLQHLSSFVDLLVELAVLQIGTFEVGEILRSFLGRFVANFAGALPDHAGPLLHRAIFCLIGVSADPHNTSGWLHTQIVRSFNERAVPFCGLSLTELAWCRRHGFVELEGNVPQRGALAVHPSSAAQRLHFSLAPGAQPAQPRHLEAISARGQRRHDQARVDHDSPLPPPPRCGPSSAGVFVSKANAGRDSAGAATSTASDLDTAVPPTRRSDISAIVPRVGLVYECGVLFEVVWQQSEQCAPFAEYQLKAGGPVSLVEVGPRRLRFWPCRDSKTAAKVLCTFNSHREAYDYLVQHTDIDDIVLSDGLMMKRGDGNATLPIVSSWRRNATRNPDNAFETPDLDFLSVYAHAAALNYQLSPQLHELVRWLALYLKDWLCTRLNCPPTEDFDSILWYRLFDKYRHLRRPADDEHRANREHVSAFYKMRDALQRAVMAIFDCIDAKQQLGQSLDLVATLDDYLNDAPSDDPLKRQFAVGTARHQLIDVLRAFSTEALRQEARQLFWQQRGREPYPELSEVFCQKSKQLLSALGVKVKYRANSFNMTPSRTSNANLRNDALVEQMLFGQNHAATETRVLGAFGPPVSGLLYLSVGDRVVDSNQASNSSVTLGYFLRESSLEPFRSAEGNLTSAGLEWIVALLRSPLSRYAQVGVLQWLEGMSPSLPLLSLTEAWTLRSLSYPLREASPKTTLASQLFEHAFDGAFVDPHSNADWAERQGNCFGLRIFAQGAHIPLVGRQQTFLPSEILDLHDACSSMSNEAMFEQLLKAFAQGALIVVLLGVDSALAERFFKWTAEHTKKNPWRSVWFVGLSVALMLPENIDRIAGTIPVSDQQALAREAVPLNGDAALPLYRNGGNDAEACHQIALGMPSSSDEHWKLLFGEHFERTFANGHCALFGCPGMGKTFFIFELKKQWINARQGETRNISFFLDGSSEVLVHMSVYDVLRSEIGTLHPQHRYLIIIDEYHLMTTSQKQQLLAFFKDNRSRTTYLVLIGNRTDAEDAELLTRVFGRPTIVMARNSPTELVDILLRKAKLQDDDQHHFLAAWVRITRLIFGEDALSFRFVEPVSELFSKLRTDWHTLIQELVNLMLRKHQTITQLFAQTFVAHFVNNWRQLFDNAALDAPLQLPANDCVALLLTCASLDRHSDTMSYAEFSTTQIVEFHRYHPALKVYSWLHYVVCRQGAAFSAWFTTPGVGDSVLHLLKRQSLADVPGKFPTMCPEHEANAEFDVTVGSLTSITVDMTDHEAMLKALRSGYALNLAAAKEHFHHHPVSDPHAFGQLVALFPPLIKAITPANCVSLLRVANATFVETVLSSLNRHDRANEAALYTAAWILYTQRRVPAERPTATDGEQAAPLHFAINNACEVQIPLASRPAVTVDLFALFCWASKNAFNLTSLGFNAERIQRLEEQLQIDLCCVAEKQYRARGRDAVDDLLGLFTYLFSACLRLQAQNRPGVSAELALELASVQHPPHSDWAEEIRDLCHAYHGCITAAVARRLFAYSWFWSLVLRLPTVHNHRLLRSLIHCKEGLSLDWQLRILQTAGLHVPDDLADRATCLAFKSAVEYLQSDQSAGSGVAIRADSAFYRCLVELQSDSQPVSRRVNDPQSGHVGSVAIDLKIVVDTSASFGSFKQQPVAALGELEAQLPRLLRERGIPDSRQTIRASLTVFADSAERRQTLPFRTFSAMLNDLTNLRYEGGGDQAEDIIETLIEVIQPTASSSAASSSAASSSGSVAMWNPDAIRFVVLFTDSFGHGQAPSRVVIGSDEQQLHENEFVDGHRLRSPPGSVVRELLAEHNVNLFICHARPEYAQRMVDDFQTQPPVKLLPLNPPCSNAMHYVFVLDKSISMQKHFPLLESAYKSTIERRLESPEQNHADIVSTIRFHDDADFVCRTVPITQASRFHFNPSDWGCTYFSFPLVTALSLLTDHSLQGYKPTVVWMTDGSPGDHGAYEATWLQIQAIPSVRIAMVFFGEQNSYGYSIFQGLHTSAAAVHPEGMNGVSFIHADPQSENALEEAFRKVPAPPPSDPAQLLGSFVETLSGIILSKIG